jgi:hypothetical protein
MQSCVRRDKLATLAVAEEDETVMVLSLSRHDVKAWRGKSIGYNRLKPVALHLLVRKHQNITDTVEYPALLLDLSF